jgi:hypothetical protein
MRSFPFPDREASREELTRDILYEHIPRENLPMISDRAWETGVKAALAIRKAYPGKTMAEIARAEGLEVKYVPKDNITGKIRYFSEYYSGLKTIRMYTQSIEKWASKNKMNAEEAYELILSHEFFHHLECVKIGLTSKQYEVPRLVIGKWKIGKSGIRALSEIGAHGFSYAFYMNREGPNLKKPMEPLRNHAVNDMLFAGHQKAEKLFVDNPVMRFLTGRHKEG